MLSLIEGPNFNYVIQIMNLGRLDTLQFWGLKIHQTILFFSRNLKAQKLQNITRAFAGFRLSWLFNIIRIKPIKPNEK